MLLSEPFFIKTQLTFTGFGHEVSSWKTSELLKTRTWSRVMIKSQGYKISDGAEEEKDTDSRPRLDNGRR